MLILYTDWYINEFTGRYISAIGDDVNKHKGENHGKYLLSDGFGTQFTLV